jgi:hypothetical protein
MSDGSGGVNNVRTLPACGQAQVVVLPDGPGVPDMRRPLTRFRTGGGGRTAGTPERIVPYQVFRLPPDGKVESLSGVDDSAGER